ncbi:MAG: MFS transporter [Betaproteobacteria bacterium]|nr:MFS transporter [Betaproteobacteria bacterium]
MTLTPLRFAFALALLNFAVVAATRVLLALYALNFGAQPFAVGALAATFSALPMLFAWPVGRLADRVGARTMLTLGASGCAVGLLVPYLFPSLPALYVAAALNGLSFTFYTVSMQNLIGGLGRADQHARNFGTFSVVVSVGSLIGPLLSGFGIDHIGFGLSCLLLVALSLAPVLMLLAKGALLPGTRKLAAGSPSVRAMLANPAVRRVLATSSLVQVALDLFQFYMPIYGHEIGLSASAIGVVLAMFAGASFVVRAVMPILVARYREERVLASAFFIGAACFFLLPFFKSAVVLCVIAFVFGLGMGCGPPITMMLTYAQSAGGRSGEALGLRFTANHTARVIGPLLFGSIGSAFGLFPVFWLNALLLATGGWLSRRAERNREGKK